MEPLLRWLYQHEHGGFGGALSVILNGRAPESEQRGQSCSRSVGSHHVLTKGPLHPFNREMANWLEGSDEPALSSVGCFIYRDISDLRQ